MNFKIFKNLYSNLVDFSFWCADNNGNIFLIVNPLSETFDDFVDDLISSDVDLLKGELDFLLMLHLFYSIDLNFITKTEIEDNESLAA